MHSRVHPMSSGSSPGSTDCRINNTPLLLLRCLRLLRRLLEASAVRACRLATSGDRFEADFFSRACTKVVQRMRQQYHYA